MVETRFFHWRTFWEWKVFSARNLLEKLLHIREVNLSSHHIRCPGRLLGKLKKQLALSTRPKISVLILAFSGITGKVDNNREVFKGCYWEFSFHLIMLPEFPRFSVERFAFRKYNTQFFSGNYCTICLHFESTRTFDRLKTPVISRSPITKTTTTTTTEAWWGHVSHHAKVTLVRLVLSNCWTSRREYLGGERQYENVITSMMGMIFLFKTVKMI